MLEALGLKEDSGVIYELINYRSVCSSHLFIYLLQRNPITIKWVLMSSIYLIFGYSVFRFFKDHELGNWDLMIDGLINVSNSMSL